MKQNTQSIAAFQEAQKHIPGGVNSPVRSFKSVDDDPLFIASAKGAKIFDIDGHEYIDYVGSWGPMILGHAHPDVILAIQRTAAKGTSFGAPTPVSYTHLRAHETRHDLVCRLLLEKKKTRNNKT